MRRRSRSRVNSGENLPRTPPNVRYIPVHPFSNDVPEQEALNAAQIGPMPLVESIWVVKDAEVVVDTVFLDVRIRAFPLDGWVPKVRDSHGEATECAFDCREFALHALQVWSVQNEAFQVDPLFFKPDLNPAMNDVARRKLVGQTGNGAFLKLLVDRECMESARDSTLAQQRHKQSAFGVALAVTVAINLRSGYVVGLVVTEGDFVLHEIIDASNPLVFGQDPPTSDLY